MRTAVFILAIGLIALITMAFSSRGPEEMIVNAIIVTFVPAALAFINRQKPRPLAQFLGPSVIFVALTFFMLVGKGVIPIGQP